MDLESLRPLAEWHRGREALAAGSDEYKGETIEARLHRLEGLLDAGGQTLTRFRSFLLDAVVPQGRTGVEADATPVLLDLIVGPRSNADRPTAVFADDLIRVRVTALRSTGDGQAIATYAELRDAESAAEFDYKVLPFMLLADGSEKVLSAPEYYSTYSMIGIVRPELFNLNDPADADLRDWEKSLERKQATATTTLGMLQEAANNARLNPLRRAAYATQ